MEYTEEIHIEGELYLTRHCLKKTETGKLMLHHIWRSDAGRDLHDHPWDFTVLMLDGCYIEMTPDGEKKWLAGDSFTHKAEDLHRLILPDGPVWSLVRTGPLYREWGFQTNEGWLPHQDYFETHPTHQK